MYVSFSFFCTKNPARPFSLAGDPVCVQASFAACKSARTHAFAHLHIVGVLGSGFCFKRPRCGVASIQKITWALKTVVFTAGVRDKALKIIGKDYIQYVLDKLPC